MICIFDSANGLNQMKKMMSVLLHSVVRFNGMLFLFLFISPATQAQQTDSLFVSSISVHTIDVLVHDSLIISPAISVSECKTVKSKHPRLTAAVLCLTLGPFGVHRLYLGTKPIIPVAYTLTLGGGLGLLTVTDFLLICFSRDITPYMNNPHFFMWTKEEE